MSIGKNLKKIRKERSLRQKDVADMVGISRSFYSDIENDRKNVSSATLLKISDALDISVNFLTTGKKTFDDYYGFEQLDAMLRYDHDIEEEHFAHLKNNILNLANNLDSQPNENLMLLYNFSRYFRISDAEEKRALSSLLLKLALFRNIYKENNSKGSNLPETSFDSTLHNAIDIVEYSLGVKDEMFDWDVMDDD